MMDLTWTDVAKQDLTAIHSYIARDSLYYADEYIDRLIQAADGLKEFPRMGRVVPEIGDDNVREVLYGSYRLMYHIDEDANMVSVTQVSHGAQQFRIHQ